MKLLFSLILLIIVTALGTCTPDVQRRNIIVPLDLTKRSDSCHIVWFKSVIGEVILPNMGLKDRLVIIPVDRNSTSASEEIFTVDFLHNVYGNEFAGFEKRRLR